MKRGNHFSTPNQPSSVTIVGETRDNLDSFHPIAQGERERERLERNTIQYNHSPKSNQSPMSRIKCQNEASVPQPPRIKFSLQPYVPEKGYVPISEAQPSTFTHTDTQTHTHTQSPSQESRWRRRFLFHPYDHPLNTRMFHFIGHAFQLFQGTCYRTRTLEPTVP